MYYIYFKLKNVKNLANFIKENNLLDYFTEHQDLYVVPREESFLSCSFMSPYKLKVAYLIEPLVQAYYY